jgi:hypothetical protein
MMTIRREGEERATASLFDLGRSSEFPRVRSESCAKFLPGIRRNAQAILQIRARDARNAKKGTVA